MFEPSKIFCVIRVLLHNYMQIYHSSHYCKSNIYLHNNSYLYNILYSTHRDKVRRLTMNIVTTLSWELIVVFRMNSTCLKNEHYNTTLVKTLVECWKIHLIRKHQSLYFCSIAWNGKRRTTRWRILCCACVPTNTCRLLSADDAH